MILTKEISAQSWWVPTNSYGIILIRHFSKRACGTRWMLYPLLWKRRSLLLSQNKMVFSNSCRGTLLNHSLNVRIQFSWHYCLVLEIELLESRIAASMSTKTVLYALLFIYALTNEFCIHKFEARN